MSEEMKKVDLDELDEVSGGKSGKHGHRNSLSECPEGTIEIKNEQLKNTHGHKDKCPFCDNKKGLVDHFYFMVDTSTLVEGQECPKCNGRWISHGG